MIKNLPTTLKFYMQNNQLYSFNSNQLSFRKISKGLTFLSHYSIHVSSFSYLKENTMKASLGFLQRYPSPPQENILTVPSFILLIWKLLYHNYVCISGAHRTVAFLCVLLKIFNKCSNLSEHNMNFFLVSMYVLHEIKLQYNTIYNM